MSHTWLRHQKVEQTWRNISLLKMGMSIDPTAPKCITLGSMRSSHLSFKMHLGWLLAFKSPYINACRVNSNTHKNNYARECWRCLVADFSAFSWAERRKAKRWVRIRMFTAIESIGSCRELKQGKTNCARWSLLAPGLRQACAYISRRGRAVPCLRYELVLLAAPRRNLAYSTATCSISCTKIMLTYLDVTRLGSK